MFTRFEQDHIDPQYVANMKAASEYFESWLQQQAPLGFNAMLTAMRGFASRCGYAGYTHTDGPQVTITGQFRGVNKEAWRPLLKKEWFDGVEVQSGNIWPVLRAAELRDTHHLIDKPGGYELYLPHESLVPVFLDTMANTMAALKQGFCAACLADYIQYFVVGHPFEKINFSICMAQVNVILRLNGFEPIYHEYLDFECFVYDYDRIEEILSSKLRRTL